MAQDSGMNFQNWQGLESSTNGALSAILPAYLMQKSGLEGFFNSNAPKGYEFAGGRFQKISPAGSAPAPTSAPVPATTAAPVEASSSPSPMQPAAPLANPLSQPDVDPRAAATLNTSGLENTSQPTQFASNSSIPSASSYTEGPGILSSLVKMFG